jgi:hypothetical protein
VLQPFVEVVINFASFPLTDFDDQHDQTLVMDTIDEAITRLPQLDLVTMRMAGKMIRWHMRTDKAFSQLSF